MPAERISGFDRPFGSFNTFIDGAGVTRLAFITPA
jgi:hypothetical protein